MIPRFALLVVAAAVATASVAAARVAPAAAQDGPGKLPGKAPGEDVPAVDAPDGAALDALTRFQKDIKAEQPAQRLGAITLVSKTCHPTIAAALWDVVAKEDVVVVRTAALKALQAQRTSSKSIGPKVRKFLVEAAEENRKRKARGDYGVRTDPKTGKTDTESPEGKAALQTKRERGAMLFEGVKLLDATGLRDEDSVEALRDFLSDGNDDLVVMAIEMLTRWKEWTALPDFADLFDIYPSEDHVNIGSASVDTGSAGNADAQAAKRAWTAKYGDPDRRRKRPKLVVALKKAIFEFSGEKIEEPRAFRDWLRRPDVKRKVK